MSEEQKKESTLHFLDYWRVIRSRKEIVLAVLLLVVITGTAYTFTLPKIYAAQSRIEVNRDNVDIDPFSPASQLGGGYDPYFLRTQFEIIQSKPILYEVINRLNLQEVWGKKGEKLTKKHAYKILRSSLTVGQSRDTSLVSIMAKRQNPKEAMQIANELADVYRDARLDLKHKEMTRALDALRRELETQQEKVNAAEQQVEDIREELDVTVISEGIDAGSVEKLRLQQLEGDRIASRVQMLVEKARYEREAIERKKNFDDANAKRKANTAKMTEKIIASCTTVSEPVGTVEGMFVMIKEGGKLAKITFAKDRYSDKMTFQRGFHDVSKSYASDLKYKVKGPKFKKELEGVVGIYSYDEIKEKIG